MNYTELSVATQDVMPNKGVLFFKSGLSDFIQVGEPIQNEDGLTFVGKLDECGDTFCPNCSRKLVKNGSLESTLKHVAIGGIHTNIRVSYARFRCLNIDCQFNTRSQSIPFKADGYRITKPLKEYTEKLLSYGLTLKAVAWLTGLDKMTVKSIHKSLLLSKFTTDGKTLIKPERQAKYLAIDEFKLHDGHKYATAIIDWETGYILYLAHGKKKAVVFEFMDHVGDEWMSKVEAVACDMNSDFEEAFKGRYPKLDIVYDRKTLNWMDASEIPTMDLSKATDATSFNQLTNTMEGLVPFGPNSKLEKALATSEKVSKDGKTYTYTLRKSKWSDGSEVTAKDFVYSWQRTVNPKTASQYSYLFSGIKNADAIVAGKKPVSSLGIKAVGKYKLVITLDRRIAYFDKLMGFAVFFPQSEKAVKKYGSKYGTASKYMLYNGPFKQTGWTGSNLSWKMVKNPELLGQEDVKLDAIKWSYKRHHQPLQPVPIKQA
jgi:hypothetical protein